MVKKKADGGHIAPAGAALRRVGDRLRMVRELLGLDQTACAEAVAQLPSTWSRWESGQRTPDTVLLASWCDKVGCSLDFIYRGRIGGTLDPNLAALLGRAMAEQPPAGAADAAVAKRPRGRPRKHPQPAR